MVGYSTVFQTNDGSARRITDVYRNLPDAVAVLPVAGCAGAVWAVVVNDVADEACVQRQRAVGSVIAGASGIAADSEYGDGLLDIHRQVKGLVFCRNSRCDGDCRTAVGLPRGVDVEAVAPCTDGGCGCRRLSAVWKLWSGSRGADGDRNLATGW